ncbi:MAG: hypothetical protein IPH35_10905 [Rhodoferax sp.]|nr:hypothetical protein [Rhodoferax sp.]
MQLMPATAQQLVLRMRWCPI